MTAEKNYKTRQVLDKLETANALVDRSFCLSYYIRRSEFCVVDRSFSLSNCISRSKFFVFRRALVDRSFCLSNCISRSKFLSFELHQ